MSNADSPRNGEGAELEDGASAAEEPAHDADGAAEDFREVRDFRDAVIRYLVATDDSDEAHGEDTVPIALLQPLIDGLAIKLSRHEKNCRHAPAILRPLAHMQVRALRREGPMRTIWRALWRERNHEFVQEVVDDWLSSVDEMAEDCRSGEVYGDDWLTELLGTDNPDIAIAALASTLWSLGLEDTRRSALFDVLVLVHGRDTAKAPAPVVEEGGASSGRLKHEIRELRGQLSKFTQDERQLQSRVRRAEREVATQKEAADAQLRSVDEVTKERDLAKSDLDEANRRLRAAAELGDQLSKQVERWRRRNEGFQADVTELESRLSTATRRESAMTAELAAVGRQLAELQVFVANLPSAEEMVAKYIREQEERVDLDLATLQGGARLRAEQSHAALMKLERAFLEYRPEFRAPRPVPLIHKGPIRYWGLGGGDEVGASAYLLEIAGRRILVDCGIRVGKDLEDLAPDLGSLPGIDAMIVTHAHTDHVGWLPAVVRNFGEFPVYTSPESQDLIPVMLNDSLNQLTRLLAFRREKERHRGIAMEDLVKDPYERKDKDNALLRLWPLDWGQEIGLRGDLRIRLFPAGHILGAAAVLIEGDGRKIVVSGDFATFSQRTVVGASWPEEMLEPDLLIMESTYGNTRHGARDGQENLLVERVSRLVKAGGVALIPCFALGRAQEVLSILEAAMATSAIDRFTVWIDGMIQKVNAVYRSHGRLSLGPNFREVATGGYTRDEVISSALKEPCAIVTTSGMLAGGPGVEYAKRLLDNSNNRLFFVGYLDEESPGRKLLKLESALPADRYVDIADEYGETQRIRAAVPAEKVQLSAHSDALGLEDTVRTLAPDHTVLVHGETAARRALADRLAQDGFDVESGGLAFELGS